MASMAEKDMEISEYACNRRAQACASATLVVV